MNSHSENSTTKEKNEMKKGLNLLTQNDEFYLEDSYIYAEDETEFANSSLSVLTPSLRQGCEPWNCNGQFCEDRCPCTGGIGGKPPRNPRNNSLSEGVEIKRGTQFFEKKFFLIDLSNLNINYTDLNITCLFILLVFKVKCALTLKDNDVCLMTSPGGWKDYTCATSYLQWCKDYQKTMHRCCPEKCKKATGAGKLSGNFTAKTCAIIHAKNSTYPEGACEYPFDSRMQDCAIPGIQS